MNFSQELKKLNKQQREAVEAIEGPVMVIAGPGTGKTQVLTLRIANILKRTDTSAKSILALTFTESAAQAMKDRLLQLIGPTASQVSIKTIHGFCNDLIQRHPAVFKDLAGSVPITELEQVKLIRSLLDAGSYPHLRPFGSPYRNVKEIISRIQTFKQEERALEDKEFQKIYAAYQRQLRRRREYDYSDMIVEVARALKRSKNFRRRIQEQYLYILVDEHQDTNFTQNKIIELLAEYDDQPNLFVVGDPQQAIYRFQGARPHFKTPFGRDQGQFLDSSRRLAARSVDQHFEDEPTQRGQKLTRSQRVAARFRSRGVEPSEPMTSHMVSSDSPGENKIGLATRLERGFKMGSRLDNFSYFKKRFKKTTIITLRRSYRSHQTILDAALDISAHERLQSHSKHEPRPIRLAECSRPHVEHYFIAQDIRNKIRAGVRESEIAVLYRDNKDAVPLVQMLERYKIPYSVQSDEYIFEDRSSRIFIALLERSGLTDIDTIIEKHNLADSASVQAIVAEINSLIEQNPKIALPEVIEHLDILRTHKLRLTSKLPATHHSLPTVQLMTAHRSKGQEFEYVYIVGATEQHWGKRKGVVEGDDQYKVFYVALTRAKQEVIITYSRTSATGREQAVSEFVRAIRPQLIQKVDTKRIESEYKKQAVSVVPSAQVELSAEEKQALRKRFLQRGLSASALNMYMDCPQKFYVVHLLGIAEKKHQSALLGEAAHTALYEAVTRRAKGKPISKKQFLQIFERELKRLPLRPADLRPGLRKGKQVLGAYFNKYHKTWNKNSASEYSIGPVRVGQIKLRGRIDRIDFLPDSSVHVVDYKFKKPVALTDAYRRQLTFYKLLIERGTKWKMRSGEINFLEPNPRGKFKQHLYAPSDTDLKALEAQIRQVTQEISDLEFFTKGCRKEECQYCSLQEVMKSSE